MTRKVSSSDKEYAGESMYWKRFLKKYSAPWILLFIIVLLVWRMSQPVWNRETATAGNDDTRTVTGNIAETTNTATGTANTQQLTLPSGKNRVQVIVDVLNMRSAPSMNASIIDRLTRGTIVAVESREGKWIRVRTVHNRVGYISSDPKLVRRAP